MKKVLSGLILTFCFFGGAACAKKYVLGRQDIQEDICCGLQVHEWVKLLRSECPLGFRFNEAIAIQAIYKQDERLFSLHHQGPWYEKIVTQ